MGATECKDLYSYSTLRLSPCLSTIKGMLEDFMEFTINPIMVHTNEIFLHYPEILFANQFSHNGCVVIGVSTVKD